MKLHLIIMLTATYLWVRCVCDGAATNPPTSASVEVGPSTAAARTCRNTLPTSSTAGSSANERQHIYLLTCGSLIDKRCTVPHGDKQLNDHEKKTRCLQTNSQMWRQVTLSFNLPSYNDATFNHAWPAITHINILRYNTTTTHICGDTPVTSHTWGLYPATTHTWGTTLAIMYNYFNDTGLH